MHSNKPAHSPLPPLQHQYRCLAAIALLSFGAAAAQAQTNSRDLPGKGVSVQPLKGTVDEEMFQTLLVARALEKLGYRVQPVKSLENGTQHVAVAQGDATFTATHWIPLHRAFYESHGADKAFYRAGTYSRNAVQGYLIDKATAEKYKITSITQLKDSKLAALFDTDGDGKADLTGCNPGWGCELAINKHLKGLDLESSITHRQGNYQALIADTITRYKSGKPILYYVWTPFWVNTVLRPGKEVSWLEVPNIPGAQGEDQTQLPNGKNYGFRLNQQYILANKAWAEKNPAAAKLFAVMQLPIEDINAQNMRMRQGESSEADVGRHVDGWIKAHQHTFDGWLEQARAAAK
ncbi:glycine betaine/L-proline ABC transporter substrate-binding protein ProX [Comamonas testosteroni]|uniref:glycine betaine/L-proline ABC transporter substrate-binding protein ProX n=1 Tax=Comamonas testosteroni TaxID=285 RepID=UPI00265DABB5|nr:glycine betaine/L-proline ABC transporter substrate-binding protein ProX [Comamonas testosteroni]WKL16853.1 glycine betaine/L-proline ABC transporter substrate-binding protein ProX [Comamonas testosteroni]